MRLHLEEWGDPSAPPLVCLHGVTGHGGRYERLAERLDSRFRILAPDLRGHGRSDWEPPWSIEAHLADLVETTERAGVERARWIGHSFGGRLAIELAAREPDRVERMVLLDPAVWVPPPAALERAEDERRDRVFASVEEAIAFRLAEGDILETAHAELELDFHRRLEPDEAGRLRPRYCPSAAVTAYSEMASPPPPFERLRIPTLIVRGIESNVTPDLLIELFREGAGAWLEVVDVPGFHNVLWDAFDESLEAIERFL